jgi:hypothetical protein
MTDMNISSPRHRRFWLAEAMLVAAILVFGGFALMSDARLSPTDFLAGMNDVVGR